MPSSNRAEDRTPFQDISNTHSLGNYHHRIAPYCFFYDNNEHCYLRGANFLYVSIQTLKNWRGGGIENIMPEIKMKFRKDVVKPVKINRLQHHFLMTCKMCSIHPQVMMTWYYMLTCRIICGYIILSWFPWWLNMTHVHTVQSHDITTSAALTGKCTTIEDISNTHCSRISQKYCLLHR
jgi:hypothetical protein